MFSQSVLVVRRSFSSVRSVLTPLNKGSVQLPEYIVNDLKHLIKTKTPPTKQFQQVCRTLSEKLHARSFQNLTNKTKQTTNQTSTVEELISYTQTEAVAYAALRFAAIFTCTGRVLGELRQRNPSFSPTNLLDFGSGVGAGLHCAAQFFSPIIDLQRKESAPDLDGFPLLRESFQRSDKRTLSRFVAIEPSDAMTNVAFELLKPFTDHNMVEWRRYLDTSKPPIDQFDLILSTFTLSELVSDEHRKISVRGLWKHIAPGGVLVLIEPGTPVGFSAVKTARAQLLNDREFMGSDELRAHSIAPCTHNHACPIDSSVSWCHFSQRMTCPTYMQDTLERSNRANNFTDEKFSYIVLGKGNEQWASTTPANTGRVIFTPQKKKGHVRLDICDADGKLKNYIVPKSSGATLYKASRKTRWGDTFVCDQEKLKQDKVEIGQQSDQITLQSNLSLNMARRRKNEKRRARKNNK